MFVCVCMCVCVCVCVCMYVCGLHLVSELHSMPHTARRKAPFVRPPILALPCFPCGLVSPEAWEPRQVRVSRQLVACR